MTAITPTERGDINGGLKIKCIQASVTSSSDTITLSDMESIRWALAYVNGTEATPLDLSISNNVITTAGHSSGTETWDILIVGN